MFRSSAREPDEDAYKFTEAHVVAAIRRLALVHMERRLARLVGNQRLFEDCLEVIELLGGYVRGRTEHSTRAFTEAAFWFAELAGS